MADYEFRQQERVGYNMFMIHEGCLPHMRKDTIRHLFNVQNLKLVGKGHNLHGTDGMQLLWACPMLPQNHLRSRYREIK